MGNYVQSQCIGQYHTITLANEQLLCTLVTMKKYEEWFTNNSREVIILRMRD